MRRSLLFALASCLLSLHASAAPAHFQDPLDTPSTAFSRLDRSTLLAAGRTAAGRLVAVGRRGVALFSDDNGVNWRRSVAPVSTDLVSVFFTGERGWAVGHGGVILASEDGGATWSKQLDGRKAAALMKTHYSSLAAGDETARAGLEDAQRFIDDGPGRPFLDVWFENASVGYAVGAYNLIFRTDDGGKRWIYWGHKVDNPDALHLNAIARIGDSLFLAGEQGRLWKLDGKTSRFIAVPTPYKGTWFGIVGDASVLLAYGLRGNIWRSGDGGASWNQVATSVNSTVTAATRAGDGRFFMVTLAGDLLESTDSGLTFSPVPISQPMSSFGLVALPSGRRAGVLVVGARGAAAHLLP